MMPKGQLFDYASTVFPVIVARNPRIGPPIAGPYVEGVALMVSGLAEIIASFCWRGCLCRLPTLELICLISDK